MKFIIISLVASCLIAITQGGVINNVIQEDPEFDRDASLTDSIRLFWHVNTATGMVNFTMIAEATGWIGFGFSKSRTMLDADLVMGGVKDGVPYFADYYALGNQAPKLDDQQDWTLTEGTEDATTTTLKFERKLKSDDPNEGQDLEIKNANVMLLWAKGDTDDISYHKNVRGTLPINFMARP